MTDAEAERLEPGQRVSHRYIVGDEEERTEYGIVVAIWPDPEHHFIDAYVAFFGESWPEISAVPSKPYVLRYSCKSLTLESTPQATPQKENPRAATPGFKRNP